MKLIKESELFHFLFLKHWDGRVFFIVAKPNLIQDKNENV